jgi:ribosomal protein S18 acetylase RimI-like enzyme
MRDNANTHATTFRYLSPKDHAAYRQIRAEALATDPDAFGETLSALQGRTELKLAEWLTEAIIPGRKCIAIIEESGRSIAMCGFGLSDEDRSSGFIWGMFVSRLCRRKGCGKQLLASAESWISGHDGHRVVARVAACNDAAIALYRSANYTIGAQEGTLRPGSTIPLLEISKVLRV